MQQHTLKAFDADIDGMRSAIMTMGGLVEEQFSRAIDAIERSDLRLIAQVLTDEEVVNQQHLQADLLCNQILAKRQPFAVDLREVIGAIHTVNDLERIGDEAKKIALRGRGLEQNASRVSLPFEQVRAMSETVRAMLQQALDAFLRHDPAVAQRLIDEDATVDRLRDELIADLLRKMSNEPGAVSAAMDLVFVVQSIERCGDHAKNIAQYVVTVVEGVDKRHFAVD
ncbi:MAG: phosphate signaling complex protein PhoU [Burkholderiaceae bacterium]|nr:phosphate signaling complex protein PhoU [Burkholderiaceae bacterium]